MSLRVGVLLPRSKEFPSMSFDLLEGIRASFERVGLNDTLLFTQNIGFGQDPALNYALAEKLIVLK